jgi:hypothetical protein
MTIRRGDHLFNLNNQPAFQIGVPFSRYEKAEAAIHDAFGSMDQETVGSPWSDPFPAGTGVLGASAPRALLARSEEALNSSSEESCSSMDAHGPSRPWNPKGWFPEDATEKVWSSNQPGLEEMLVASLEENEIHCRLDQRDGHSSLWVLPGDEDKAREIIRQVEQGIAPE